ncbi:hypothetical protein V5F89_10910 [Pelagerythrobacter marensis]|uniref:Colicin immunity protein n=1 Tax=Pelagerythrobacter marensis TaxID=543877 RepID=A0ABZ2D4M9_9SPHN
MNDIQKLYKLASLFLSDDEGSFDNLMKFIDDLVSSDRIYELDHPSQRAILSLQEDLAIFDPQNPKSPDVGFLSLDQVKEAVRLYLHFSPS